MKQSDCKNRFPVFKERLEKLKGDMSNTEFATFLGMSRQTVGFYLNGERIPDILSLKQIAEKCNVSADYLIDLSDEPSRTCEVTQISNTTGLSVGAVKEFITCKNSVINERGLFMDYVSELFGPGGSGLLLFMYLFRLMGTAEAVRIWNNTWGEVFDEYVAENGEDISKEDDAELNLRYIKALENFIASNDMPFNTKQPLELILDIQKAEQQKIPALNAIDFECEELCDIDRARVIKEFNRILSMVEN